MINHPEDTGRAGRPHAGIAIQKRIGKRGFTQTTLARELTLSQSWVSQSLLDDPERTLKRLVAERPDLFTRLLTLLDWDYSTFRAATGILRDTLLPGELAGEARLASADLSVAVRHVPVIDLLSAGPGSDGGTVIEQIDIPEAWTGHHAAYEIAGVSMSPNIPDGAIVVVRVQDYATPGNEIVCYSPDHGMLVKCLKSITPDGQYVLTSYNPEFAPIWARDITIYGVVVEVRTRRKPINGNHATN